ncbi:MAG TPA: GNAT family N-acetyltransferase [Ferruginibacter sp.]|nr:GNAT family N-acetyltransferase [Ferruginibacter sp.]
MLSIKKAGIREIPLIRKLTLIIWPQTYSSIISSKQMAYMLEMMYSPVSLQKQMNEEGCTFIVAYDEDEAVAFASYNEIIPYTWKLNKIYILPSQQGKGTGRFIINHIITEIKKEGANFLQLQVNRHNQAKLFYEKLGFKIIDISDFDIGNGFFMNDYVMELAL